MRAIIVFCFVIIRSLGLGQELDCPECGCTLDFCSPGRYCFMQSVSCVSLPCPELPSCIATEDVCPGKVPSVDDKGAVKQCSDSKVCPDESDCESGFCCMKSTLGIPDGFNTGDGMAPSGPDEGYRLSFIPKFAGTDKPASEQCTPCATPQCQFETCKSSKPVRCIADNCSCMMWFEDMSGNPVICEIPDDGIPPIFFNNPTSTIPTTATTEVPALTLQTTDNGSKSDNTLLYALGGFGIIALLMLTGLSIYGIMRIKQRRKHITEDGAGEENELKVPLNELSSHNNNEIKHSKPLVNAPSETDNIV